MASILDQVRLEIGDTDVTNALLSDAEIQVFIDRDPDDVLVAAASACDALSRRFARQFDFAEDGQSFSLSQRSKQYAELALRLRNRSAAGFATLATTRTDGYSDDIDYRQSDASSARRGRVKAGWWDPDLPL